MDKQFIVITHGKFAEGIKNSLEMLIGKQENLIAVSCYIDEKFNLEKTVKNIIEEYKDKKIVFCTDIFGGSVNNYLSSLVNDVDKFLVTGINLSLLIELVSDQEKDNCNELLELSVMEARNQLKQCKKILLEESEEDFWWYNY